MPHLSASPSTNYSSISTLRSEYRFCVPKDNCSPFKLAQLNRLNANAPPKIVWATVTLQVGITSPDRVFGLWQNDSCHFSPGLETWGMQGTCIFFPKVLNVIYALHTGNTDHNGGGERQ